MFLSAEEIQEEVRSGALVIHPFLPSLLKPASYVVRLGYRFRRWAKTGSVVDPWAPDAASPALQEVETGSELVLHPGDFVLVDTLEEVGIPAHLVGLLSTLSHWGRFGVSADNGSWLVSPGFGGGRCTRLTLELASSNPNPLRLRPGMPLAHLVLARTGPGVEASLFSQSIYEGLPAPSPPRLFEEFGGTATL